MFEVNGNNLQITLPDFSTFFAIAKTVPWHYWMILNAAYGYLTHLKSLPGYYKYKKEHTDMKPTFPLEWLFIARLIGSLPLRVIFATAGLVWSVVSLVSTGNPRLKNELLVDGWHWHQPPQNFFEDKS